MTLCSHCGATVAGDDADRVVTVGRLEVGPHLARWEGRELRIPAGGQFDILRTLALSFPRVLSKDALVLRLGLEDRSYNLTDVQLCKLRRALIQQGVPGHRVIRTFHRKGLVLMDEQGRREAA